MKNADSVHALHDDHVTALERARLLWYAAAYSDCLRVLDEEAEPSADRFLLAAWACYGLRRYDDALAQLASGHALFAGEQEVESDALSAVLHQIKGNARESDVFYERAAKAMPKYPSGRGGNMLALRAWMRDDFNEALRRLRAGEASEDPSVRAQALSLRSWTHASRRDFAAQAAILGTVLQVASAGEPRDIGRIADTILTLSGRCRELYLPEQFEAVCSAMQSIQWTPDLHEQEYHTRRNVALTWAMQGQYVVGLRELQRVAALARTPSRRALSSLDSAWVALASGERNTAQALLQDALELIEGIDWQHQIGSESNTLLLAAEVASSFDPALARRLLDTYEALKPSVPIQIGVRHDRSFDPVEAYTRARVLSISDVGPARKLAKQAYREFAGMRYDWRAARCALFLYESGCGDTWLAAAKQCAQHYPRSFIGAQLQRIDLESNCEPLAKLTPRQRDVVRLLAEGDTVDAVAAALKTSPGTVRVHLKHIHRTLGVRNRVELLRLVRRSA
ncbi:MAG TPA: LuxR C-terminal-related transcriptional regulator [Candidatus Baltobacteraceae bacterium]|jgi:DNA-binding CsgD family transcriptional regulator/tetratricopeptide (TPR) repeat protein|nr:LuxR C-terminal-related transcriptional regulator [Candidatus Baltobacteraceae bacterium]